MMLSIFIGLFVLGGLIWFYFAIQSASNMKEGKIIIFLTPFWMFMPSYFSETGNRYRVKALALTVIMLIALAIFSSIME